MNYFHMNADISAAGSQACSGTVTRLESLLICKMNVGGSKSDTQTYAW